ncbi:uncharacterized protein LOC113637380 [Tachysurus fulvidraco]|uniref:uncharacterized protein LOC113637380 n=1 Tax=Tachysurus fulvidraco TaxID=1234273 RepID=UPI001FEF32E0|nr:uncharacterized protein LOC113637380 [Tachysurus fulvidraco]XP_047674467.1 uncharacterized protein LOC113637380 [Tachysurus fulvidraco]
MQFCNLHHCVLFFLIFTTAPVSVLEICPTRAKLHQPATLSCTTKCSGLLIWNILSNRDVVLAQCDQTSCKSEEGFSISHDQYLKGDSSLTITAADYSKRNVYACECEDSDFVHVRLVIETVFTQVQTKSDEDLKLKVSVPEPVEVIYKSDDAADEVICSVTNGSLQCKDEYRHRTSLIYPELTLKHMTPRDSGSYTIRDTKNNEDIQIYAVSVEAVFTAVQVRIGEHLKLKVSVPEPVEVIYKSSDAADEVICNVTKDSLQCKDEYRHRTSLTYPELTLRHMTPRDSGSYTIWDTKNNEDLEIYAVSVEDKSGVPAWVIVLILILLCCCVAAGIFLLYKQRMRKQLERRLKHVYQLVQQAKGGTEEKISEMGMSLDQLEKQYNNTEYSAKVKEFCSERRKLLLMDRLKQVNELVHQAKGGTEEKISEVEMSVNQLEQQYNKTEYSDKVLVFCSLKRDELFVYKLQHQNIELQKEEQIIKMVEEVVISLQKLKDGEGQAQEKSPSKIDQMTDQVEKRLREIEIWCSRKRVELPNKRTGCFSYSFK